MDKVEYLSRPSSIREDVGLFTMATTTLSSSLALLSSSTNKSHLLLQHHVAVQILASHQRCYPSPHKQRTCSLSKMESTPIRKERTRDCSPLKETGPLPPWQRSLVEETRVKPLVNNGRQRSASLLMQAFKVVAYGGPSIHANLRWPLFCA